MLTRFCRRRLERNQGRNGTYHFPYRSTKPYCLCCRTHVEWWPCRCYKSERTWWVPFELMFHPSGTTFLWDGTWSSMNDPMRLSSLQEPLHHLPSTSSFILLFHMIILCWYSFHENHCSETSLGTFHLQIFCTLKSYAVFHRIEKGWNGYQLIFHKNPFPLSNNIHECSHILHEIILRFCMYWCVHIIKVLSRKHPIYSNSVISSVSGRSKFTDE